WQGCHGRMSPLTSLSRFNFIHLPIIIETRLKALRNPGRPRDPLRMQGIVGRPDDRYMDSVLYPPTRSVHHRKPGRTYFSGCGLPSACLRELRGGDPDAAGPVIASL